MRKQLRVLGSSFVLCGLVLAAMSCGDDDPDATGPETSAVSTTEAATDGTDEESVDEGPAEPPVALTGAEICDRLDVAAMSHATGQELTSATPDMMEPVPFPNSCTYSTGVGGGEGTSGYAVLVQDMTEQRTAAGTVGFVGRDGLDAFVEERTAPGFMVEGESLVPTELEEGDGAVVMSGRYATIGVVLIGERVVSVVAPAESDVVPPLHAVVKNFAS